jgi:hypothetical protein
MRSDNESGLGPLPKTDRGTPHAIDDEPEEHLVQRHVHVRAMRRGWNQIPIQIRQVVSRHCSASIPDAHASKDTGSAHDG